MLANCSQNVIILYNSRDYQDKSFFSKLDRDKTLSLVNCDANADAAVREDMGEEQLEEMESQEKARRFLQMLQMQDNINQNNAIPPKWSVTAEDLGLTVVDDLDQIDEVTGQNFKILYHGVALKTWQGEVISWMKKMLLSPLRGAVLADGVGLGKTFDVLVLIIVLDYKIAFSELSLQGHGHLIPDRVWLSLEALRSEAKSFLASQLAPPDDKTCSDRNCKNYNKAFIAVVHKLNSPQTTIRETLKLLSKMQKPHAQPLDLDWYEARRYRGPKWHLTHEFGFLCLGCILKSPTASDHFMLCGREGLSAAAIAKIDDDDE